MREECNRGRGSLSHVQSSPQLTGYNKENESPLPKYKRDLVQKMKVLRQELQAMQPQAGHCRIEVSREEIFEVLISNLCLDKMLI